MSPNKKASDFLLNAFVIIIIFTLSACASTQDIGKMQYSVGELEKKVEELGRRSQIIESEMPKSEKQFSEKIEGTKDSQEATARAVSNLFMKMQSLSGDVQQITGRLDESQHLYEKDLRDEAEKRELLAAEISGQAVLLEDLKSKLDEIKAGMDEIRSEMDKTRTDGSKIDEIRLEIEKIRTNEIKIDEMITEIEKLRSEQDYLNEKVAATESRRIPSKKNVTQKTDTKKPDVKKTDTKKPETDKTEKIKTDAKKTDITKEAGPADVKDVYNSASELFKAGKYKDARAKFMSVIKDFKENEYSDNAKFWIGECFFKEKMYEDSILAYEELLKKYPDSDKIPSARLKQGLAFYELNDSETGDLILKSLIDLFPDSKEAAVARKKLGAAPERL
ncbi:MAG: tol-pal system protein YbgF [Nitrospirae bacterium]|nr:tol-pal system protein YbgF [Nitrospirota bacterium]